MKKVYQLLSLLICILMIMAVSIRRDGKVLGHAITATDAPQTTADAMRQLDDGTTVINTTDLAKDVIGYSGTVPLEISVKDGSVIKRTAFCFFLKNNYFCSINFIPDHNIINFTFSIFSLKPLDL